MTLDEMLALAGDSAYSDVNDILLVDPVSRTISVPNTELVLGVESDERGERKWFKCPKIVGNNIAVTSCNLRINYRNANGEYDWYSVDDVTEQDDDTVLFSWELSRKVTKYKGDVHFILCLCKTVDGLICNEWNTTLAVGKVLEGIEPTEHIDDEDVLDIIAQLESYAERAEAAAAHQPVIGSNGNWYTWDGTEYVDTGLPSRGEQGPQGPQGETGPQGEPGLEGAEGLPGEDGRGVVKYYFEPSIWRWVMTYTDDYLNTYPGFDPQNRDKFVVWRDDFNPGRAIRPYGVGEDTIWENGRYFYDIGGSFHGSGIRYGVEEQDGRYVAKLSASGTGSLDYNHMVAKCHSWSDYTAQMDFMIQAPPTGVAQRPGLILNPFHGYSFPSGTILIYIDGGYQVRIVDNTTGGQGTIYMYDEHGDKVAPAYGAWYTAKITCAEGVLTLTIWPMGGSEADGWSCECRTASLTDEVIQAEKALRIQTRPSRVAGLANTVYIAELMMWEDYVDDIVDKVVSKVTEDSLYEHISSQTVETGSATDMVWPSFKGMSLLKAKILVRFDGPVGALDLIDAANNFVVGVPDGAYMFRSALFTIDLSHGCCEVQLSTDTGLGVSQTYTNVETQFTAALPINDWYLGGNFDSYESRIDVYGVRA